MPNHKGLKDAQRQEPITEERGEVESERTSERKDAPDTKRADEGRGDAQREPVDDHRRLSRDDDLAPEAGRREHGAGTGDESEIAQRRASGSFTGDGEPSQREEDFGERGLRTAGGPFDNSKRPSILDPEND